MATLTPTKVHSLVMIQQIDVTNSTNNDAPNASALQQKRSLGTPQGMSPPAKTRRKMTGTKNQCCNCTKESTCSQARQCACNGNKVHCRSCVSYLECKNTLPNGVSPTACTFMDAAVTPKALTHENKMDERGTDTPASDGDTIPTSTPLSRERTQKEPTTTREDLPHCTMTAVDHKLMEVYGDCLHQNHGTHPTGGVEYDPEWQQKWHKVVATPSQCHCTLNGKTFNYHQHCSLLTVRGEKSKEGITQSNPTSMITYGILLLPLIWQLKLDHPLVNQPGVRMMQEQGVNLMTSKIA